MSSFTCLKCGECCKNQIQEIHVNLWIGLNLFPEEKQIFPKETISPHEGVGVEKDENGSLKPKHVITFQLNLEVCPHLSEDVKCKIYEKRPLFCRAFPIIPYTFNSFMFSPSCKALKYYVGEFDSSTEDFRIFPSTFEAKSEWEPAKYLMRRAKEQLMKYRSEIRKAYWIFDLKSNKWVIMKSELF